jgi:hypothetical protein
MNKVLGFATSFAFAASLAFASLTLPFFAGEAAAQLLNPLDQPGPGAFPCGPANGDGGGHAFTCDGEEVIIDCFEGCDVEIIVPVMTMIEFDVVVTYILTDGVVEFKEFVSVDCCPIEGVDIGPHTPLVDVQTGELIDYQDQIYAAAFGNPAGVEAARLIEQAEADAEDAAVAAVANALLLQQAEEEKACRGVPLALKHLLCAAKI